jgi:hypothetical protein
MTSDTHEHEHGPGCGHTAIRHDDHCDDDGPVEVVQ